MKVLNETIDLLHRPFSYFLARLVSLFAGISISCMLLFNFQRVSDDAVTLGLGYLSLLMLALSTSFIHGLGFYPRFWLWKLLFSPYFSWLILLTFTVFIFR